MSKRLKNYPDPQHILASYGAGALRLYLINSPVVRADDLDFKEAGVKQVLKDCFLPWCAPRLALPTTSTSYLLHLYLALTRPPSFFSYIAY